MLSREIERDLLKIAKYARRSNTLYTLIDNEGYSSQVRHEAARNPLLPSSALSKIVSDMYGYDHEVLFGVLENPNISRTDIIALARHNDIDVAMAALGTRKGLTTNPSVLDEFMYSEKIELSKYALDLGFDYMQYELAGEIIDLVRKEENPIFIELSLRSIADPLVLHALAESKNPTILNALSKNPFLPPAIVALLLANEERDVILNVAANHSITTEQLGQVIEKAMRDKDLDLYAKILESPKLNGTQLEYLLRNREDFYAKVIDTTVQYLSEETKAQVANDMERFVAESLNRNRALDHNFVSEKYSLNYKTPVVSNKLLYIEDLCLNEEMDLLGLYDDLVSDATNDLDVEELLVLADQEDIDPDIKKTVMLAMLNRQGNSLQSMNHMQNRIESIADGLVSVVGVTTIGYHKNVSNYLSTRKRSLPSMMKGALHRVNKELTEVSQVVETAISEKVTELKSKLPTEEMTDLNLPKQLYDKVISFPKTIRSHSRKNRIKR